MPEQQAAAPAVQPDLEVDPKATASQNVSEPATQPDPSAADSSSVAALGFSATETAELVGITYRQLDHWAREGLIVPSMAKAQGSGSRRRYTYNDLLELKIVKKMRDAGIDLKSISRSFDYLRNQLGADVASSNIVISGADALLVDEDTVLSLLREGQGTMLNVLPVAGVKRELDADVVKLFPDEPIAVQLSFEIDADD
ncbi:MerR family transcriptional regulator [Candidatus Poriferisodalis sp.]|uniref:MerR family transcriptional regulator n=1 Tax=Candidatus Poriferisodalis sp. TaxID=3101277 RepID=UPI003B018D5B